MNKNEIVRCDDFRCMRGGKQLLTPVDDKLIAPIHIRKDKKRHAILLLHGFGSTPAVFRQLLPFCADYDAVFAPCLPGHGSNLADFAKTKLEEIVSFVETLCTTLMAEFDALDVLGLSMGGAIASHLSTSFKFRHLYLLAPALDLQIKPARLIHLCHALRRVGFRYLRNKAGNLYRHDHCEIAYRQLPLSIIIELLSFIEDNAFPPSSIKTDLFLGRYDEVVDSDKVVARFVNNPEVEIHLLQHSAHVLPLDGDYQLIGEVVRERLNNTLSLNAKSY